jgi:hypothetical protein
VEGAARLGASTTRRMPRAGLALVYSPLPPPPPPPPRGRATHAGATELKTAAASNGAGAPSATRRGHPPTMCSTSRHDPPPPPIHTTPPPPPHTTPPPHPDHPPPTHDPTPPLPPGCPPPTSRPPPTALPPLPPRPGEGADHLTPHPPDPQPPLPHYPPTPHHPPPPTHPHTPPGTPPPPPHTGGGGGAQHPPPTPTARTTHVTSVDVEVPASGLRAVTSRLHPDARRRHAIAAQPARALTQDRQHHPGAVGRPRGPETAAAGAYIAQAREVPSSGIHRSRGLGARHQAPAIPWDGQLPLGVPTRRRALPFKGTTRSAVGSDAGQPSRSEDPTHLGGEGVALLPTNTTPY